MHFFVSTQHDLELESHILCLIVAHGHVTEWLSSLALTYAILLLRSDWEVLRPNE